MTGCAPGRAHDDLLDAGRARGDHAHDDGRRVRRAAAGDVDRRAAHGHLAQADDLAGGQQHLALVVAPGDGDLVHVGDRHLEPGADVGVEVVERSLQLVGAHAQRAADVVEALDVLAQRGVAAGAHVGDDGGHRVGHRGGAGRQRPHGRRHLRRIAEREALNRHAAPPRRAQPRRSPSP